MIPTPYVRYEVRKHIGDFIRCDISMASKIQDKEASVLSRRVKTSQYTTPFGRSRTTMCRVHIFLSTFFGYKLYRIHAIFIGHVRCGNVGINMILIIVVLWKMENGEVTEIPLWIQTKRKEIINVHEYTYIYKKTMVKLVQIIEEYTFDHSSTTWIFLVRGTHIFTIMSSTFFNLKLDGDIKSTTPN